jgi:hypothetical protein
MATTVEPFTFEPPSPDASPPRRRRIWLRVLIGILLLAVAGAIAAAAYVRTQFPKSSITGASQAFARVHVAGWGDKLLAVKAVDGDGVTVPTRVSAKGWVYPTGIVRAGETITVTLTVRRPSWARRLVGDTEHVSHTLTTPRSVLKTHWIQTRPGKPVQVRFDEPVRSVIVTRNGKTAKLHLARPRRVVSLPRSLTSTPTGSVQVSSSARTWEHEGASASVTWFPPAPLAAEIQPSLGATLTPMQPLTFRLNRPLDDVLGQKGTPQISPSTVTGDWKRLDDHTLTFVPTGAGYPFGHTISVTLPKPTTVQTRKGQIDERASISWFVPNGSQLRLEQLLSQFGYLPLKFVYDHGAPSRDPVAQLDAAVTPPTGHWSWKWKHLPASLQQLWTPGDGNKIDRGALMRFQNDHGLAADGIASPATWDKLLNMAMAGNAKPIAYTYVEVTKSVPETLRLWKNGKVVVTAPANTGIASAPTPNGTWPVYSHLKVTTMSGTDPSGHHYNDPGIPWVSYFNGGDALHAFPRGSYGVPQSLGCVELQTEPAAKIWPDTPIGTLVTVTD